MISTSLSPCHVIYEFSISRANGHGGTTIDLCKKEKYMKLRAKKNTRHSCTHIANISFFTLAFFVAKVKWWKWKRAAIVHNINSDNKHSWQKKLLSLFTSANEVNIFTFFLFSHDRGDSIKGNKVQLEWSKERIPDKMHWISLVLQNERVSRATILSNSKKYIHI